MYCARRAFLSGSIFCTTIFLVRVSTGTTGPRGRKCSSIGNSFFSREEEQQEEEEEEEEEGEKKNRPHRRRRFLDFPFARSSRLPRLQEQHHWSWRHRLPSRLLFPIPVKLLRFRFRGKVGFVCERGQRERKEERERERERKEEDLREHLLATTTTRITATPWVRIRAPRFSVVCAGACLSFSSLLLVWGIYSYLVLIRENLIFAPTSGGTPATIIARRILLQTNSPLLLERA